MKILQWWKRAKLDIGCEFDLVPKQEAREDQALFTEILKAVKASDLDFILIEQTEVVSDYRTR